jgi:hypothetical protein
MTQTLAQEAWCPSCRVTHPPGTRRCLHCGGSVLAERPGAAAPWPIEAGEDEEAREPARAARPLKIAMAALWVVLAIVTGILRACAERG